MDIVIIDRKALSSFRLASIVEEVDGVNNITQIMNSSGVLRTLEKLKPHLIIYNISVNGSNHLKTLGVLRETYPGIPIIVLVGTMIRDYCKKVIEMDIDYCLDSTTEFDKIPFIIQESLKDRRPI